MSAPAESPRKRFAVAGMKKAAWRIAQARAFQVASAGCGGIVFLLQLLICAVLISGYNEIRKKPNKTTYFLHSSAPFHAVRIPFTLQDGHIILPGELSDKKLECQYDTGCAEIMWNKKLHLAGERTSRVRPTWDMTDKKTSTEEFILPSLRFGSYEVRQQSTWAMDAKSSSKSMMDDGVSKHPIVGNEVFRDVVVTIDYYKKELIVRSPDYDFTHQPLEKNARVIPFTRTYADGGRLYGQPRIEAQINGVTTQAMVDTGCVGGIWMNSGLVKVIERKKGRTMQPVAASATDYMGNQQKIYHVQMRLGKNTKAIFNLTAQIHPNVTIRSDYDALAGYDILRYFRITIDYPRQKILLEPFDEKIIQIVPKGTSMTITRNGRTVFKKRINEEVTIFRHADGTTVITRHQ